MLQLTLSVLVSVSAAIYHVHAAPYRDPWLNVLQGVCLIIIWLTLQAGMMVAPILVREPLLTFGVFVACADLTRVGNSLSR